MQVDIDFDVYKTLTTLRESEADSYSDVLRRVLGMPPRMARLGNPTQRVPAFGAWFGNVHFPDGTKFRATYKGRTFVAEIRGERWLDEQGISRTSPSDAAKAICGTNVNGWRFWHTQRPGEDDWHRLDALKS